MKKPIMLLFLVTLLCAETSYAQETFPRNDVKDDRSRTYAFTNATIFINATTKIEGGTLLVRDGKIEKSGTHLFKEEHIEEKEDDIEYLFGQLDEALIDSYADHSITVCYFSS